MELIGLTPDVNGHENPFYVPLLFKDLDGAKRKQSWHYHSAVGMLVLYNPDPSFGIQWYIDADFAGSWAKAGAENPENVMSRTGFIIIYAGYPVLRQSKLQTKIALSNVRSDSLYAFDGRAGKCFSITFAET
eukprot:590725-Ditylum_brightwellii.AAC.1